MKKKLHNLRLQALLLAYILAAFYQVQGQTLLLTENWETAQVGQTPPAGWSVDLVSGTNYIQFLQNGTFPACSPYNGTRMVEFQSYYCMYGTSNRLKRTTPVQTTGYATVSIDFAWYPSSGYAGTGDNLAVQWSVNGTTWVTAATFHRYSASPGWRNEIVPLPAGAANQPALYIAFKFTSDYGDNCHLDLVHVNGYLTAPAPPTVTTLAPSWVGAQYVYLAGNVNANGNTTNASFQYGLTTSYGSDVTAGTVTGNTIMPVYGYPPPLIPGHLYHCRAVGTSAGGTVYGNDVTFTTLDTLAQVFTYGAGNVGYSTATVNGRVYPNGSTTAIAFDYGLTPAYGSTFTANPATISGDSLATWASASITGLAPNTTYHYRITGTNSSGTSYGLDSVFTTTNSLPPTVFTNPATAINSFSAVLNGEVNANGTSTTVTFQYGVTTAYGSTVTYGTVNGNTLTPVSKAITGLTQGTLYHFRAVGVNANGTTYGNDSVFTTAILQPPSVTTNPAPYSGSTYAILSGTFNANGNQTTTSFQYGLTTAYDVTIQTGSISGTTPVTFQPVIYWLIPGRVYHFRAVGSSAGGISYGNDMTFTTADTLPAVYTYSPTSVGVNTATMNGRVYPNGSTTTIAFEYGLTTSYGTTVSANPASIPGDTLTTWADALLTGLSPNTTYHARIKGINGSGTSYGMDTVFTTYPTTTPLPTVITTGAYYATASNAVLSANVNPNGYPTAVSFEYGLTPAYGSTVTYGTVYGNTMTYTYQQAANLLPATVYHYRAVGTSAGGTAYGSDTTFTTNDSIVCQAYFTYSPGLVPGNYTFDFTDLSTGNPASWLWNFDDPASGTSNFSTLQNPVHTYSAAGAYNVCLTITNTSCNSTFCKSLEVIDSVTPHHLSGQVFASGIPIQTGVVNLFSVDTIAPYQPYLDISSLDSSGTYHFYQVPDGDYYVNAIPAGVPGYLPTFYGDAIFWEDATVIHLGVENNPYDIHLAGAAMMVTGNGTINGQINTSGLKTDYVDKITMLLFKSNGQVIAFDPVTPGGVFSFASLGYGTYFLKAEMAGISSELFKVILSPENPAPQVTLTFSGNQVSGTEDPMQGITSWVVYPNPVTDKLTVTINIKRETKATFEIFTLTGQPATSKKVTLTAGTSTYELATDLIPPGIYFLQVNSATGGIFTTKIIKTK